MKKEGERDYFTGINDLVFGLARKRLSHAFRKKEVHSIRVIDDMLE